MMFSPLSQALLFSAAYGYTPVPNGVLVPLSSGWSAVLAVEGLTAFRFSLVNGSTLSPTPTSMLSPKQQYAQFTVSQQGSIVNLTSPGLGSVTVNASSGAFALANAAGVLLTHSPAVDTALVSWGGAAPAAPAAARNDSCLQSYNLSLIHISEPTRPY